MNTQYESHTRVWEMLKPRVYAQLELSEPSARTRPPAVAPVPGFLNWYSAAADPAILAHGQGELTSPLSEW